MHTGNYDPGAASLLDVSVDVDGVANDAEAVAAVSSKLQESSGKDFSEAVARAIKEYRSREAGWHKPNACATLQFTPASGTLHLHAGQSGHFTGQVKASRGGTSSGRWHLVGRQNATISPSSARGTEPTFLYHVTSGSPQAAVSATFETTSRAGVAKGTWSQNQRRLPRVWRGTVVNQFKSTEGGQTNFTRVDASVTFTLSKVRSHFGVTEYDYTISGTVKFETSFAGAGCTIEGAGAWDIKPSWGHMDITVTATAAGTHTLYFFEASRVPYTVTYHSVMQCRTGSGIETTTSEEPFGGFEGPQFSRPMRIDARTIDGEEVGDKGNGFNRWHLVAVD
jgi:hypothetical protein